MDNITQSQFNTWKNEEVGKVFFNWLKYNIKEEKIKLEELSKNPLSYSQEDYYKKCMECGINLRNWESIYQAKIDFIQSTTDLTEEITINENRKVKRKWFKKRVD